MSRFASKRIALDVDNVLADTAGRFCTLMSERMNYQIKKEMIRTPKIVGSFRADPKLVFEVLNDVWREWTELPTIEGDINETIHTLRSGGACVIIATARPFQSIHLVKSWLVSNSIEYDELRRFEQTASKSILAADALVDDDQEQAADFVLAGPKGRTGYIYDQPWNRSILPIENLLRISRLRELL